MVIATVTDYAEAPVEQWVEPNPQKGVGRGNLQTIVVALRPAQSAGNSNTPEMK